MSVADYSALYADAGQQYGVDPALLMAQGQVESGGDPDAYNSGSKASGLAQLTPATARALGVTDPTDPKQAIAAQARLMAENIKRYGDIPTALKAYHGGTDQSNWGPKTQAYPQQVLKNYQTPDDPIEVALSARAQQSNQTAAPSGENDPIEAALAQRASAPLTAKAAKQPSESTVSDVAKTAASAPWKAVGAVPQIPAMAGNAVANAMGYVYGKLAGATPEQQQKLNNLNPFFTGNTPLDALDQSAKALIDNDPGPQNPLTGNVLHDPTTTPGRYANAIIQGGVVGPMAGAGIVPSVAGAAGAQGASEALPNNPLATLAGGGLGFAAGKLGADALMPTPLPAETAGVIKNAKDDFNINTPASVMTNGNNLVERIASKADTQDLGAQVNKAVNDLMGANANGEGHAAVNQKAYLDAVKNNSRDYNQLFSDIGDVPLQNQTGAINDALKLLNPAAAKEIGTQIINKMNPDGSIPAAAIKGLTKDDSVLQKYANNRTDTISSNAADNIVNSLQSALKDKATPEQANKLTELDTRYKTMKAMEPIARQVGAGKQAALPAIQATLNKAFGNINDGQVPPVQLSNYLNTINASSKSTGGLGGVKPAPGNKLVENQEAAYALMSGHPHLLAVPLAQRGARMAASSLASKYINTDWYKNRLLRDANP